MRSILIVAALCILAACGSSAASRGDGTSTGSEQGVEGPLDPYSDPPGYEGDPFEGFPSVTTMAVPDFAGIEPEPEILSGAHFTIQVAAASGEEAAAAIAASAEEALRAPVFVDHLDGFWKVRVGAFATREDAEAMLGTVAGLGYPDAWVTTRVP